MNIMKSSFVSLVTVHSAIALAGVLDSRAKINTPLPNQASKAFSLTQVPNPHYQGVDAQAEYIKALAKYGQKLSDGLKQAIEETPSLNNKFKSLIQQGQ